MSENAFIMLVALKPEEHTLLVDLVDRIVNASGPRGPRWVDLAGSLDRLRKPLTLKVDADAPSAVDPSQIFNLIASWWDSHGLEIGDYSVPIARVDGPGFDT